MEFEWDSLKDQGNIKKHGISFDDAMQVFNDIHAIIIPDDRFDYQEDRFIITGEIMGRIHVVAYCERENNITRIISARKATRREVKRYANS
ncbi:MAG: BrnT family toxin [Rhizobiales bacterium]|nr:BrnT family toxin [Hyphomicrobiales bacterium]